MIATSKIPALRLPARTTSDTDEINDINTCVDQSIPTAVTSVAAKPARPSSASKNKAPQPSIAFGSRSSIASSPSRRAPAVKTATSSILSTTNTSQRVPSILDASRRSSSDQSPSPAPGTKLERPRSASLSNSSSTANLASRPRPSSTLKQRQAEEHPTKAVNSRPQRPLSASASKASQLTTQPPSIIIADQLKSTMTAAAPLVKPSFKLNLAALNNDKQPVKDQQTLVPNPVDPSPPYAIPGSGSGSGTVSLVPKLNLIPMLQQQSLDNAHENNQMVAYQEEKMKAEAEEEGEEGALMTSKGKGNSSSKSSSIKSGSNHNNNKTSQSATKQKSSSSSSSSHEIIEPPSEHFYFYPKMDRKEEKKTLGLISTLPKVASTQVRFTFTSTLPFLPQLLHPPPWPPLTSPSSPSPSLSQPSQVKRIYDSMVEAKQNCEAIAFRGHRLLDQLNGHMKEQLSKAEQREVDLQSQLSEYQAKVSQQEAQLQSLMMVLQGLQGLGMMDLNLNGLMGSGGDSKEGRSQRSTEDEESQRSRSWGGSSARDEDEDQREQNTASPSPSPSLRVDYQREAAIAPPTTVVAKDMFSALSDLAEGMKTMRESVNQMSSRYAGKFN